MLLHWFDLVFLVVRFIDQAGGPLLVGLDRDVVTKFIEVDKLIGANVLNVGRNHLVIDPQFSSGEMVMMWVRSRSSS